MERLIAAALIALALSGAARASAAPRLIDGIFADHGVVQRDRPITVWGEAAPGASVKVALGKDSVKAMAGADGIWRATLPARPAGGPYSLSATSGGETLAVNDLLAGDVFLCSGQSNMEWPVGASVGGKDEVARSADPGIRLLTIPQHDSAAPIARLAAPAAWKVAGPDTTGDFSAVCFFMAQDLRRARPNVPIGLIDNSWGGSAISAWLRPEHYLAAGGDPKMAATATLYARDPLAGNRAWAATWQGWWSAHEKDAAEATPWAADFRPGTAWQSVPMMDRWSNWQQPALKDFVGLMWYRTSVTLTPDQARQGAWLLLGGVDDLDQSWVNGRLVGTAWGNAVRRYPIPADTLVAGDNSIVVNDFNTWADGGMTGPPESRAIELADGTHVPLAGTWLYRAVTEFRDQPPRAPWDAIAGVGPIQNGMVAPLGRYGIKAAAWYQGESDAFRQLGYASYLQALIRQWRADFGRDLPVAVIQLPNFGKSTTPPVESEWAGLREGQRRALESDPHAALVVTIDAGDPANLHPPGKRLVGARLARAMEHIAYGNPRTPSGPMPISARRNGKMIRVVFGDIDGRLQAPPAAPFELCGDSQASCHLVAGRIDGASVLLPSEPAATRVRYCWADSPTCTLRDAALPATPFELPIQ